MHPGLYCPRLAACERPAQSDRMATATHFHRIATADMTYEVELKFPVADSSLAVERLQSLGAIHRGSCRQRDTYFAHPQRSFAETNEALRLRQIDDENFITYKGPVIDRETKTRREIELSVQPGDSAGRQFAELWEQLGFQPVQSVVKMRDSYQLNWQNRQCEVCVDRVEQLGTFMEVETIAQADDLADAKQVVLDLAAELDLLDPEPRSYLELLLNKLGEVQS